MLSYPASMEFNTRRSTVISKNGMVAASQPLAVAAGLEILRLGGNAADAAIATASALNVTEPTSTGLGGDCFALFYDAKTKQISALNGSGRSPSALTLERIKQDGFVDSIDPFHPHSITVPGAAAAWCDLLAQHGNLSIAQVLAPAIRLAAEGFPVAPITAYHWRRGAKTQLANAPNGEELTISGHAPAPGQVFYNPGLARTFQVLAEGGKDAFYQGTIAEAIVEVIQKRGGVMTEEDLASHTSTWVTPISINYHDYRVWECPPNSQGIVALLALNILEEFNLSKCPPLSVERLHLIIESLRLAFADARWFVSDPSIVPIPVSELLSKSYAQERCKEINLGKANIDQKRGVPLASSDTVYLSVVDRAGNACSFINSNYMGFGTGYVPKGWGFTLQNRGAGFSLDSEHPNVFAANKRPYHTIIPSIITHAETNELFASFGVMGGFMQPQGHVQVVLGLINDKIDPQVALDRPRLCIYEGDSGGMVALEKGIPVEVMSKLGQMGHIITPFSEHRRATFGRGQVILRDKNTGVLWGGSDPRADGLAMGE